MGLSIEDFAHRCLLIKAGNVQLPIPCCANCKYYADVFKDDLPKVYVCQYWDPKERPKEVRGCLAWLHTNPDDFCSRWEAK